MSSTDTVPDATARAGRVGAFPPPAERSAGRARGGWVGDTMTWLHEPGSPTTSCVVLLPPLGYEYWTAHATLRATADALAAAGHTAVRLDYPGLGDSAGTQDATHPDAWVRGVRQVVRAARDGGFGRITLVGLRLGAAVAWATASALARDGDAVDALVLWHPVSGRHFARELRVLGEPIAPDATGDDLQVAGSVFTADVRAALSGLGFGGPCPVGTVWLAGPQDSRDALTLAAAVRDSDAALVPLDVASGEPYLGRPTEYADVDEAAAHSVAAAVPPARPGTPGRLPQDAEVVVPWRDSDVVERVVALGPDRLVAVATEPAAAGVPTGAVGPTVVWVNSGSEMHAGPGRAWVELARDLALRGISSVRFDARGWGESFDPELTPARPYDAQMAEDLAHAAATVRARTGRPVVLAGLCSGAWMSLDTQRSGGGADIAGVVAMNPQLYWKRGDVVEANIRTETHVRRAPERAALRRLRESGELALLEQAGFAHPAAAWLDALADQGARALFLFSESDDGLEFLQDAVPGAWERLCATPGVRTVEVDGLDHGLHRWALRGLVTDAVAGFVATLCSAGSLR